MNLRTRFALAFAAVAAAVAGLVGLLSYNAAADRISNELDRTLQTSTTALQNGQNGVLSVPTPAGPPGPDRERGDRFDEQRQLVAHAVAPDGALSFLGGRDVALPLSAAARALAATGDAGATDISEVDAGGDTFRVMTTALGGTQGALQVGVDIDDSKRVLGGMANEIAWASLVVLLVAAGAGWLLARRITARLARLAWQAEHLDVDDIGGDLAPLPVDGHDEVGRLSTSFNIMLARLASARDAQERLVQDAAHELRTPLTTPHRSPFASAVARSSSPTEDPQSRPPTASGCSTASTAPTPHADCPARVSAWPSSATSPKPTGAPPSPADGPGVAPRSASASTPGGSCRTPTRRTSASRTDRPRWSRPDRVRPPPRVSTARVNR